MFRTNYLVVQLKYFFYFLRFLKKLCKNKQQKLIRVLLAAFLVAYVHIFQFLSNLLHQGILITISAVALQTLENIHNIFLKRAVRCSQRFKLLPQIKATKQKLNRTVQETRVSDVGKAFAGLLSIIVHCFIGGICGYSMGVGAWITAMVFFISGTIVFIRGIMF